MFLLVPASNVLLWLSHQSHLKIYVEDVKEIEGEMKKVARLWRECMKKQQKQSMSYGRMSSINLMRRHVEESLWKWKGLFQPIALLQILELDVNTIYKTTAPRFLLRGNGVVTWCQCRKQNQKFYSLKVVFIFWCKQKKRIQKFHELELIFTCTWHLAYSLLSLRFLLAQVGHILEHTLFF